MRLDDWQERVLEAAMGERSDGTWAARIVGLSAPRQNGKSFLIAARALAGVLLFNERTILVSAHQQDTSREVFRQIVSVIDDNPALASRIADRGVKEAMNREEVRFANGASIKFKARSLAGGRGFSADCLLLDEAQNLPAAAWASVLPTMSARPNAQAWLFGTPPTETDDGESFGRIRLAGVEKSNRRMAYLEWSAGDDDDIDDPAVWLAANPSLGSRLTVEAVEAERAAMSDEQFRRERLGMWSAAAGLSSVIPGPSWKTQSDSASTAASRPAVGVEIGPDLAWCSIAVAGERADGSWHIALAHDQTTEGKGVEWLYPRLEALLRARPDIRSVVVDVSSPIKAMIEQRGKRYWLKKPDGTRGIEVHALKVAELGVGCTSLLSGVVTGEVWHIGQPQLSAAALSAGKRPLGDTGMWVWNRRAADSDITPIQAATYALIGAQLDKPRAPSASSRSGSGSKRRVVVM